MTTEDGNGSGGRAFEHLRAAFVCVHVVFVLLLALPVPAITPDDLDKPGVQSWFDRTHAKLTGLGLDVDRDTMVASAAQWGGYYGAARDHALVPAAMYANWTGAKQSWRMFSNISHGSARLMVEREDAEGEWHPVYVGMDFDHAWRLDFFQQERTRTLVNNFTHKKNYGGYKRLGRFLLPRLQEDFPEATDFRLVMQEVSFPEPEVLAVTGTLEFGKRYWGKRLGEFSKPPKEAKAPPAKPSPSPAPSPSPKAAPAEAP